MSKLKDLTGQRFGRLTVLERAGSDKHYMACWKCRCECGNELVANGSALRNGHTKSCGCLQRETAGETGARSRRTHRGTGTRLYHIWQSMKARCYNPHNNRYRHYGGRGITICDEWLHDFAAFRDWALSHGYRDDLSIDRIDVNGNYEPSNCRWATVYEQRHNRRDTKAP